LDKLWFKTTLENPNHQTSIGGEYRHHAPMMSLGVKENERSGGKETDAGGRIPLGRKKKKNQAASGLAGYGKP